MYCFVCWFHEVALRILFIISYFSLEVLCSPLQNLTEARYFEFSVFRKTELDLSTISFQRQEAKEPINLNVCEKYLFLFCSFCCITVNLWKHKVMFRLTFQQPVLHYSAKQNNSSLIISAGACLWSQNQFLLCYRCIY